jgi:uncharacterized membrane protein YoaK (UPF0700 family)
LLSWTGGLLDGLSYITAHVFTANMTGNLVLLGIQLGDGHLSEAGRVVFAMGCFALGCVIAGLTVPRQEERGRSGMPLGFSIELAFLAVFAVLFPLYPKPGGAAVVDALIFTAAAALAVQSVTVRQLRVSGVVTTFITGTITTAIVEGLTALRKRRDPRGPRALKKEQHSGLLLSMLAVYFAAVLFGAVVGPRHPELVGATPAAVVAMVLWRSRTRAQSSEGSSSSDPQPKT